MTDEEKAPEAKEPAPTKRQLKRDDELEAWAEVVQVLEAIGDKSATRTQWGPIGYSEGRAIRYVYVVMGWGPDKICRCTGRNYKTIHSFIRVNRLRAFRDKVDARIMARGMKNLEKNFESILGLNAELTIRFLQHQVKNFDPENIDFKAMKMASDMGKNFQTMLQIIRNKPTSIVQHKEDTEAQATADLVSLLKRLHDDPLFDRGAFLRELGLDPGTLVQ